MWVTTGTEFVLVVQEALALPAKILAKGEVVNNGLRSQVLKKNGLGRSFLHFNSIWNFLFGSPSFLLPQKSSS